MADMQKSGQPICFVNEAFERITGYSSKEAIGKNCAYLQGSDREQPAIDTIRAAIAQHLSIAVVLRNYTKSGNLFINSLELRPVKAAGGALLYYVGIISDITKEHEAGKTIDRLSHLDDITGLLNRASFTQRFSHLAGRSDSSVLLLKLDIARFHDINGGYGYDVGDALLREVAQRLLETGAVATARMGANEFAAAFLAESPEEAEAIVSRTVQTVELPYPLLGTTLSPSFYTGYVFAKPDGDCSKLIRRAGAALHRSKRGEFPEAQTFDATDEAEARRRVRLTTELRHAITAGEFCLEFQPKLDLHAGAVVGAEALIRWRHPVFGTQPPSLFIDHAEEIGLVAEIDAWVINEAAKFASILNKTRVGPGNPPLSISVNVSGSDLTNPLLFDHVYSAVKKFDADPGWLILELTETRLMKSSSSALKTLQRLRNAGFGLSIDDFGTGYSSLRYLDTLPITELKIDRSFVSHLETSSIKRIIVEALIKMGDATKIAIVAEGIETDQELCLLKELGCPYGQGYLLGRAETADQFLLRVNGEL